MQTIGIPIFKLGADIASILLPGKLLWEKSHDHAQGAVDSAYQIREGQIILTRWLGRLHCVIYQTPLDSGAPQDRRNAILFKHFAEGHSWNEILDNGFGKTYRRGDMQRFALWSYVKDFNTFGTMEFHGVMWR